MIANYFLIAITAAAVYSVTANTWAIWLLKRRGVSVSFWKSGLVGYAYRRCRAEPELAGRDAAFLAFSSGISFLIAFLLLFVVAGFDFSAPTT